MILSLGYALGPDGDGRDMGKLFPDVPYYNLVFLVLGAGATIIQTLVALIGGSSAVSKRITSDTAVMESLVKACYFGLGQLANANNDSMLFEVAKMLFFAASDAICPVIPLNASSLIKDMNERFPGEAKGGSPVALLRRRAAELQLGGHHFHGPDAQQIPQVLEGTVVTLTSLMGDQLLRDPDRPGQFIVMPLPDNFHKVIAQLAQVANEQSVDGVVKDYCDVCGSDGDLKRCSRCLVGRFCGVQCQKKGLDKHKKVCFDGKLGRLEGVTLEQLEIV